MNIEDVVAVMNNEKAAALCLSKGGFEGWLQAELWCYLTNKGYSVERELKYPNKDAYCDLVYTPAGAGQLSQWIEVKAYGIFRSGTEARFLDGVANDVMKIMCDRPGSTNGAVFLIVPNAIGDALNTLIEQRKWFGFKRHVYELTSIYHLSD